MTGAFRQGHDVQLVHGDHVLTEAGSTSLISMGLFNATNTDADSAYLVKKVSFDMKTLQMIGARWSPPPQFDQALFDSQRRSEEWAKEAQEAREKRLNQLVATAPKELLDE